MGACDSQQRSAALPQSRSRPLNGEPWKQKSFVSQPAAPKPGSHARSRSAASAAHSFAWRRRAAFWHTQDRSLICDDEGRSRKNARTVSQPAPGVTISRLQRTMSTRRALSVRHVISHAAPFGSRAARKCEARQPTSSAALPQAPSRVVVSCPWGIFPCAAAAAAAAVTSMDGHCCGDMATRRARRKAKINGRSATMAAMR
ncbi:hypothetical protein BS50DRAFT_80130 [Corynespora cassiicola Philippines]|uniref:Uncharacterized protein n=1 Tax=Corynespora cassiicola Philippines TaxID=1448308 RepID=A0A2T2NH05_CORCC|nr:hypothetical protein BS50DRAFT_80130 [Corynespora cassiicola Philippines]